MDPLTVTAYNSQFNPIYTKPVLSEQEFLAKAKALAFKITGGFEGGKANTLQLKDSGIISYGKHQATLSSGSLYKLVDYYTNISDLPAAVGLSNYLDKLESKDVSLKSDVKFIDLLMQASSDPLMNTAQDKIFTDNYWNPAAKRAKEIGLESEIGYAVFYDTNINGGLENVINRTFDQLKDASLNEADFLNLFLDQRKSYMLSVAAGKRKKGDETTAKMLETAAATRIPKLKILVTKYLN